MHALEPRHRQETVSRLPLREMTHADSPIVVVVQLLEQPTAQPLVRHANTSYTQPLVRHASTSLHAKELS